MKTLSVFPLLFGLAALGAAGCRSTPGPGPQFGWQSNRGASQPEITRVRQVDAQRQAPSVLDVNRTTRAEPSQWVKRLGRAAGPQRIPLPRTDEIDRPAPGRDAGAPHLTDF